MPSSRAALSADKGKDNYAAAGQKPPPADPDAVDESGTNMLREVHEAWAGRHRQPPTANPQSPLTMTLRPRT